MTHDNKSYVNLNVRVRDAIKGWVMNDVTPLPSDCDAAADAALQVVRDAVADLMVYDATDLHGPGLLVRRADVLALLGDSAKRAAP